MNDRTEEWASCAEAARDALTAGGRDAFTWAVVRFDMLVDSVNGTNAAEITRALGDGFWVSVHLSLRELPMGWRRDGHGFCARHERAAMRRGEDMNTANKEEE